MTFHKPAVWLFDTNTVNKQTAAKLPHVLPFLSSSKCKCMHKLIQKVTRSSSLYDVSVMYRTWVIVGTNVLAFYPVNMQINAAPCSIPASDQLLHRGEGGGYTFPIMYCSKVCSQLLTAEVTCCRRGQSSNGKTFKLAGQMTARLIQWRCENKYLRLLIKPWRRDKATEDFCRVTHLSAPSRKTQLQYETRQCNYLEKETTFYL